MLPGTGGTPPQPPGYTDPPAPGVAVGPPGRRTLAALGGAAVYVQPTAPVPPIPLNSIWLNTTLGAFETWNGSAWVVQGFTGTQLILAGTIAANLLVAGIVKAGIVDGTLIQGASLRVKNASGATILTVNVLAGSWLLYNDTGSATQGALVASGSATGPVADEFGNTVLAGVTFYGNPSAGVWIAANMNVASGDYGIIYFTATTPTGTWTIDSWLRRSGSNAGQIEIGPIAEILGTGLSPSLPAAGAKFFVLNTTFTPLVQQVDGQNYSVGDSVHFTTSSQTISPTAVTDITGLSNLVTARGYFFEAIFRIKQGTVSVSQNIGFSGPATTSSVWFEQIWTQSNTTAPVAGVNGALGLVGVNPGAASIEAWVHFQGTVVFSASGTFKCIAQAPTAGDSFTMQAGSYFRVKPLA